MKTDNHNAQYLSKNI